MSENIPFYQEKCDDIKIEYIRVPVMDRFQEDIKKYFNETNRFIENVKKDGKVLIHCQAGISRSPTIGIAFLMKMNKLSFNDAFSLVKEKRPIIEPNLAFIQALLEYEIELKKS